MEYSMLDTFRHNLYRGCFTRAADALFDLADALLTDTNARSFVELSQAASFRRQWPSLYAALDDGVIDRSQLQWVFGDMLPRRVVGSRLVLGLDTSSIARPDARTSPDRTLVYQPNLPSSATPVVAGWQFSTLVVLPETVSSWTYILDNQRLASSDTATTTGVDQLQLILPRLQARWGRPLLLLDRVGESAHGGRLAWLEKVVSPEPVLTAEVAALTRTAMRVVRSVSAPHGFNVGLNLGRSAGGSLSEHLHQHVVPRWTGDANFITVVGGTKLLPQLLDDTRRLLADAWAGA